MVRRTINLAILAILLAPLLMCASISALDQQNGAIAQGYQVDNSLGKVTGGSLISLKKNTSNTVELTSTDNAAQLVGVVDRQPLISISNGSSKVQAVISGTTLALVSDINGKIISGDKVAPSPVTGAGMKATSDGQIVGTALSDFVAMKETSIADKSGTQYSISLGYVLVQVGPAFYQVPGSNLLPPFIQNIADSIAGRQVSLIRILIAGLILLIGFVSVGMLVYSAVRSAMTALGRNPLAAKDIRRGLYQILLIAVIVAGGAALASYFVLRT